MKASRIIINADDFGLSSPVNEAVRETAQKGLLSSATIMVNMPGFEDAVRIAQSTSHLGVGVHLNLLRGSPLCEPSLVPSLTGKDGCFLGSVAHLWKRYILRKINPEEVKKELSLQVSRLIDYGVTPTHLDSEKHIHLLFPGFWEIICQVARRHHIRCLRVVREPLDLVSSLPRPAFKQMLKTMLINRRGQGLAQMAAREGLIFTDRFFGLARTGQMTATVYQKLFSCLPSGSMEVMCHPAATADASAQSGQISWLDGQRVNEYRALLDGAVREDLIKSGAKLIHYGNL